MELGRGMMVAGEATHPQRVRRGDLAKWTRGCGGKTEGEMEQNLTYKEKRGPTANLKREKKPSASFQKDPAKGGGSA